MAVAVPVRTHPVGIGPAHPSALERRAGLITLFLSRVVSFACFPVFDDAFITYRYAGNLASGAGFVYQPGELVLGVTTPLFSVLLAPVAATGIALEGLVPWINVGMELGFTVLVVRLLAKSGARIAALAFPFVLAALPLAARVTVGGMEANLFVLMVMMTFLNYDRGKLVRCGALAAATYFVRPEGVLVSVVMGLDLLLRRRVAACARLAAIVLTCVLPWLIVMQWVYGAFLPQSILAKRHLGSTVWVVGRDLITPDPVAALLVPLAVWGVYQVARTGPAVLRFLAMLLGLYLAAYLSSRPWMWSWYAYPVQVSMAAFASLGIGRLMAHRRLRTVSSRAVAGACISLVALIWAAVAYRYYPDRVSAGVYGGLRNECHSWVRPGSSLLASDIGAVGYYCPVRILDAAGLVSPDLVGFADPVDIVRRFRPDYVFLNATPWGITPLRTSPEGACYRPVVRFSPARSSRDPDLDRLNAGWVADYVLFERRVDDSGPCAPRIGDGRR